MLFNSGLKNKLVMTTAIVAAFAGYGRRAEAAGGCVGASGTYTCSGSTTTENYINATNATVSTVGTFSAIGGYSAVNITGAADSGARSPNLGAISFKDVNGSTLTGDGNGLAIGSTGDAPGTPGSVNVTIGDGSHLTGTVYYGILTENYGSGGTVINLGASSLTGGAAALFATDRGAGGISFTSAAGSTLTGGTYGIITNNFGSGSNYTNFNGTATATDQALTSFMFNAANSASLTVITGASSTLTTTGHYGLHAWTVGTGDVNISVAGNVSATGSNGVGVAVGQQGSAGGNLNVTTAITSNIVGKDQGLYAYSSATGTTTVVVNGAVTGQTTYGINAKLLRQSRYRGAIASGGTDLSVTTGASSVVTGATTGLLAVNQGTGATTVTVNGHVTGTSGYGISATNAASGTGFSSSGAAGTDLTITTGAGSVVAGGKGGILAVNNGTGATSVNLGANATVNSNLKGVYARTTGAGGLNFYSGSGSTITSGVGTTGAPANVAANTGVRLVDTNSAGVITAVINGNVTANNGRGVTAYGSGNGVSITTGASSAITGVVVGILTKDFGTGISSITVNGNVTATDSNGLGVKNSTYGTAATSSQITTVGSSGHVTGATGVLAGNYYGAGTTTVVVNGAVTGTQKFGVWALDYSHGSDITVTTGSGSSIVGNTTGILASQNGVGANTVTVNGNVTGTSQYGIAATNAAVGVTPATFPSRLLKIPCLGLDFSQSAC